VKKVLTNSLSLIMVLMTIVSSSGMSISFMRCHISGKTSLNKKCSKHELDRNTSGPILHQNCCEFGSYVFDAELKKDSEFELGKVVFPVLFVLNEPQVKDNEYSSELSAVHHDLPPPHLSELQVFII